MVEEIKVYFVSSFADRMCQLSSSKRFPNQGEVAKANQRFIVYMPKSRQKNAVQSSSSVPTRQREFHECCRLRSFMPCFSTLLGGRSGGRSGAVAGGRLGRVLAGSLDALTEMQKSAIMSSKKASSKSLTSESGPAGCTCSEHRQS